MLQHMDQYSDSFTIDASEDSLREVFSQMDKEVKEKELKEKEMKDKEMVDDDDDESEERVDDQEVKTKAPVSILPSSEILGTLFIINVYYFKILICLLYY